MNQKDFANLLNYKSQNPISLLESGQMELSTDRLKILKDKSGVCYNWLVDGKLPILEEKTVTKELPSIHEVNLSIKNHTNEINNIFRKIEEEDIILITPGRVPMQELLYELQVEINKLLEDLGQRNLISKKVKIEKRKYLNE
jgi:hypothetical protein